MWTVEDLPAYVAKAVGLGGQVLIPPQTLPDGDQMALVLDPEGIALGFKPAMA
jgi:predicted enzyme related to lactoylglutathione lyase